VAIDSVDDLERLFHGIPLDKVSTSMTINATAAILLAMYVAVGEEQGVPLTKLQGTLQNDILKEYIARGTYIYPPEPSLRLVADIFRFTSRAKMSFNPISISGYHMREAGATAVQELGFTFANGLEYVRRAQSAGLRVDDFAPRLSFFFAAYTDLFEEIAKFRAARRLWYRLMKEKFNASDAAARLRFTPRPAARRSPPSSRSTTSCAWPFRRWPPCWVARSRSTRTRTMRRWRFPPSAARRWRSAPSSCSRTKRACRMSSIRSAVAGMWRASPTGSKLPRGRWWRKWRLVEVL